MAPQNTQVVGVHAGLIDTDLTAGVDVPKATPAEIAVRMLDGLEAGDTEVLADEISVTVKAALSGPVDKLMFALPG